MTSSVSPFPTPLPDETDSARARARTLGSASARTAEATHETSLDAITPGHRARVVSIVLDADQAAWLAAVGIREGESLTVLRRAAFGGPLHVRTHAGCEFAIAKSLARTILVRAAPLDAP